MPCMDSPEARPEVRHVGLALIRRRQGEDNQWLVLCDDSDCRHPRLLEAVALEGESCRTALERELAWQLPLRRGKDFLIGSCALLNYKLPLVSRRCSGEEEVGVGIYEIYGVELFGRSAAPALEQSPAVRWDHPRELCEPGSERRLLPELQRQLILLSGVYPAAG